MTQHIHSEQKPHFGQLAFAANRFVLEHMRRIRQNFQLELDASFVLGSLAHLNLYHGLNPHLPKESLLTLNHEHEFKPVRLRDVVQVTALPRETVRRHLIKLEAEKMICQPIAGKWCIAGSAITPEMMRETLCTVKKLLNTADELRGILDRAGLNVRDI